MRSNTLHRRTLLLFGMAFMLSAGGIDSGGKPEPMAALSLAVSASSPASAEAVVLPSYFREATRSSDMEVTCTATRDDLGIDLPHNTADIIKYSRLLTALRLAASPNGSAMAVKAPFTLRFTYGEQTDTFSFSAQGVRYNGRLCYPGNPGALEALYIDDYQGFFSEAYFRLGRDLHFTADQVASVDLSSRHMFDDILMHLTAAEPIAALLAEQKEILVLDIAGSERGPNPAGGGSYETVYTLRDGTVFRVGDNRTIATVQKGAKAPSFYKILNNRGGSAQFDSLFDAYPGVPQLSVTLNGKQPKRVIQTAFHFGEETKEYKNEISRDASFYWPAYLPVRQGNTAKLSFPVAALRVTAELFKTRSGEEDVALPIQVSADGTVLLPGNPGNYFMTVHADFPEGTVDHFFVFAVTNLPEYFECNTYGNEKGDVTVSRDDLNRSVTGGQNRQYVQFMQSLDLAPYNDAMVWPTSQVKKPFTLTFHYDGYPDQRFQFRAEDSRIICNGEAYRARDDSAIRNLYADTNPRYDDSLLHTAKAFISAEVTTFGTHYPLRAQDISSIKEERKVLHSQSASSDSAGDIAYRFNLDTLSTRQVEPSAIPSTLKTIHSLLLAKEETDIDAYDFGEYTAYDLALKDGRRFQLDRRLVIDGKASGYVLISDEELPS